MNDSSTSGITSHPEMDNLCDATTSQISHDNFLLRMVTERTIELAHLAGLHAHQIRQIDYEKAKREIIAAHSR